MTHLLVQSRNDSEHDGTPQTDSLRDSSVNHALIAIAQSVGASKYQCLNPPFCNQDRNSPDPATFYTCLKTLTSAAQRH
jgi:hypothetical protein